MLGIIGKKIGMTRVYDEKGRSVPCTVIQSGPCVVTQLKNHARDGYSAVQIGFEERKEKHTSKAMMGHFNSAKATPKRKLVEFRNFAEDYGSAVHLGDTFTIVDLLQEGEYVDVVGTSKGKGFQGVVKRHGFSGVGDRTHGQHNRERAPGSIGAASYPSRVFKGMRMAGQHGNRRVKIKNLKVLRLMPEQHCIVLQGAVPGPKNGYIVLEK